MGFAEAIRTCLRKYVDFNGRASRSEYWWWELGVFLLTICTVAIDYGVIGGQLLSSVASLALFLPNLAVSVRRLHDVDRSGWFLLLALIPLIGAIVLLVWFVSRGTAGSNRFGPDPLGAS
jgi:uncharacterized membrane protein YhaH (DUF805 family)